MASIQSSIWITQTKYSGGHPIYLAPTGDRGQPFGGNNITIASVLLPPATSLSPPVMSTTKQKESHCTGTCSAQREKTCTGARRGNPKTRARALFLARGSTCSKSHSSGAPQTTQLGTTASTCTKIASKKITTNQVRKPTSPSNDTELGCKISRNQTWRTKLI